MSKKIIFLGVLAGLIAGLIYAIFYSYIVTKNQEQKKSDNKIEVNSFNSCELAGFAVQESYPRRCTDDKGNTYTEEITSNVEDEYDMVLEMPKPNSVVVSPIKISGEARGSWFFEGSFNAEVLDSDGDLLGDAILTAEGEWMTNEFVEFTGELEFDNTSDSTGELIIKSANPSGLLENQKTLSIPVHFN